MEKALYSRIKNPLSNERFVKDALYEYIYNESLFNGLFKNNKANNNQSLIFHDMLYKSNYDALCFARDIKIVGASFVLSKIFDMIIGLVHGLFRKNGESQELYEVRTRKILLISNSIATTSSIIASTITSNPKSLDIGSLINTLIHLFSDVRYFAKIKKQFIEQEISGKLQAEIYEIDKLFEEI